METNVYVPVDAAWLNQHDRHLVACMTELTHAVALLSYSDNGSKELQRGRRHLALDRLRRAIDQLARAQAPF